MGHKVPKLEPWLQKYATLPGAWQLILEFNRDSRFLGYGTQRVVFDLGNGEVVKVPLSHGGAEANGQEARRFAKFGYDGGVICYARCRLEDRQGVPLLMMEKVDTNYRDALPAWADLVDNNQVGLNAEGRIVAYDYSDD